MPIKILVILFALYAVSRVLQRYRKKDMSSRNVFLWIVFWILVAIATLWPKNTDSIAHLFGVERGADLLIFISVVALFFLVFKIIVRQEKMNRDITKMVRKMAIEEESRIKKQE